MQKINNVELIEVVYSLTNCRNVQHCFNRFRFQQNQDEEQQFQVTVVEPQRRQ